MKIDLEVRAEDRLYVVDAVVVGGKKKGKYSKYKEYKEIAGVEVTTDGKFRTPYVGRILSDPRKSGIPRILACRLEWAGMKKIKEVIRQKSAV